ncbi:MAG: hypothetical protein AAGG11_09630 [Pseudomonadota bacterium]
MIRKFTLLLVAAVLGGGCAFVDTGSRYADTVDDYAAVAPHVALGMSLAQVNTLLAPTQLRLDNVERRPDEVFRNNSQEVLVRYYRSGWQPDGRLTDNEYTPYLFIDQTLVSVGWLPLRELRRLQPARLVL